ncbi:hypothetical protein AAFF_G00192780 [Aldrovandia affinis]|uniref:CCHC-type domain-containing protein n=1 Tax=Aldrovandia affinis TaxID=143900 RepID=A0AAD7W632_9TELE|nr:hypothetical protein AAFF_G00192780 [Aldrovandia affinis]
MEAKNNRVPDLRGPRDDGKTRNPWCPRCEACGAMPQVQEQIAKEGRAVGMKQTEKSAEAEAAVLGQPEEQEQWRCYNCQELGYFARNCPNRSAGGNGTLTQEEAGENRTWQESGSNSRKEQRP